MTTATPTDFGIDLACMRDADELFSATTGTQSIAQDAYHRLTTDDVLGPGGEGWGFDVARLQGKSEAELRSFQPYLVTVLQRDPRVETVEIILRKSTTKGQTTFQFVVSCATAAGPFEFILPIGSVTGATITGQGAP